MKGVEIVIESNKVGIYLLQYPLVRNQGVHNLDRHPDQPTWPVVHVVKEDPSRLIRIIESLNDDGMYGIIKKLEEPQNYRMREVDTLRENRINPLMMHDRRWRVEGFNLRNALDFLCQHVYEHHHRTYDPDD